MTGRLTKAAALLERTLRQQQERAAQEHDAPIPPVPDVATDPTDAASAMADPGDPPAPGAAGQRDARSLGR